MGSVLDPTGTITMTHSAVAMTTASAAVLASNPNAKYRLFQVKTTAAGNVYLYVGGTAVANTGIMLVPGQSYEMSPGSKNLDTRAITALVDTGTTTLFVTEGM